MSDSSRQTRKSEETRSLPGLSEAGLSETSAQSGDPESDRFAHLRGTAGEEQIQLDKQERGFIRHRSWRLLVQLSVGVRRKLLITALFVVIAQAAQASIPLIVAWAIDWGLPRMTEGDSSGMWLPGLSYIACAVTAGVLIFHYTRMTAEASQQMLFTLRGEVFRKTQALSLDFHEDYTSGKVISRQTSDLESLRELLDGGVNSLVQGVMFMFFTAVTIWIMDFRSGLVLVAALIPITVLARWYQRNSEVAYRRTRVSSARMIVHFVESMTGIRAVQAFRREDSRSRQYRRLAADYRDDMVRSISLFGVLQPSLMLIGNVTVTVVLLWGGYRVLEGDLGIGVLVALVLASKRVFQPLDMIAMFYNSLQSATAALEKVSGLLEESPTVTEAQHPRRLPSARGDLEFAQATFRYSEDGPEVLHALDLHIPAGQTVAVVGRTGAGKSTLAKLLARFYDVSDGSVSLDGVDLRDLSVADHHRHVAMVTQEAFLFSGTIRGNIALGRPEATESEIIAAAKAVGCHELIMDLPEGYDTDVNKRGGRLSAGQRQLISFARAFLADPAVLILDEATSSLDLPSEALVQQGLERLLGNRTALIIAHRLSTVAIADRVLVIDDGRVVEDGAPADLAAQGGYYAKLDAAWRSSMGS
ncbi:ABC transporter ATP-binding protein [Nesterenkonia jeotgali]|uniref:ATP-binding cassette subfamily B protein n=1 Tax=Nesterenkonia jeotgali TaxID=317018 RepID=A0A839G0A5_9MICC|nr:ABC transporter ATP-binding protein [Nesterenkonia jeotgali]MBA8922387.1 ATP-binding cassette subfamily B protein [Nesterenkonia jeotgali]